MLLIFDERETEGGTGKTGGEEERRESLYLILILFFY